MSALVRTGVAGLALLAVGYAGLTTLGRSRGADLPAPPRVVTTRHDGRMTVTLQLCWFPESTGGVVRSVLGPGSEKADVQPRLDCARPFVRTGTVARGDRIFLQWIMSPNGQHIKQSATYRITVNNREARLRKVDSGMDFFECAAGVRPCE